MGDYGRLGTNISLDRVNDGRDIIIRTRNKLKVGKKYVLPLTFVSLKSDIHPKRKCICTGKYKHFATFKDCKGVHQSFTYFDLANITNV